MPLSFGLWYDFRNPAPWRRPWQRLYQETLEQVAWADSLGFDSVWLSEHHFTDDGYLPALFPMLAALATRTSHMRLGTAVLLAPLHHPLRLAEDAAVVDVLSGGRLELSVAPGYRAEEFALLGVRRAERGRRTDETIEIVKAAWRAQRFSYRGSCFRFEDVVVTPPPLQRPHPPIWVGGSSQAAARRAARHGCHFFPTPTRQPSCITSTAPNLLLTGTTRPAFASRPAGPSTCVTIPSAAGGRSKSTTCTRPTATATGTPRRTRIAPTGRLSMLTSCREETTWSARPTWWPRRSVASGRRCRSTG